MLWVHHNFAEHLALFQIFVRRAQFTEWKGPIQYRLEPTREYVAQNFVQFGHRPHVGTEQFQLTRE